MDMLRKVVKFLRPCIIRGYASTFTEDLVKLPSILMVIAPHPDDETFGAGGLIAEMGAQDSSGGENLSSDRPERKIVHVVFLTSGGAAHAQCCGIAQTDLAQRRELAAKRATLVLGVPEENLHFLRLQDGKLPHPGMVGFEEIVARLAGLMNCIQPDTILAPHPFEGWSDHTAAEIIVRGALTAHGQTFRRSNQVHSEPPTLMHYCVWLWYTMPFRRAISLDWRNAITVGHPRHARAVGDLATGLTPQEIKREAMMVYLEDASPCGKPTCGVLPGELIKALQWNRELLFRVE